jgi:hypothetical protein
MISRVGQGSFGALLISAYCLACSPACGQSLSLSYKLDVSSVQLQRVAISNDSCADVAWVATVTTCARGDALGRFSWNAASDEEAARSHYMGAGDDGGISMPAVSILLSPAANDAASASRELASSGPAALSAATDARLRPAAARDSSAGLNSDVSLRLAPKSRLRAGDDEVKYSEAALQNRSQKNNFNALGLELLIPFH